VKLKAFAAALLLSSTALAQTPPAEAPKPPPPQFTFALHGFVSVSGAYQDGTYFLSEGQQAISAGVEPNNDKKSLTFDVRQSRFNFSVKGPQVLNGATPTAVLELDFFQGFGGGAYGDASLLNRLRLAYSELNWGKHRLQFGQQNDLIFAMAPTSLSHIAFPLGYFTGNLGWRRPGVFGFHQVGTKDLGVELAWEVARSSWQDAAAAIGAGSVDPANNPGGISLAEASTLPALEGRVTVTSGKLLSAFVAAHYNQVDVSGIGGGTPAATKTFNVTSYHAGAKVTAGPLTVAATGFTGKNVASLIGNFAEFKLQANGDDVSTFGFWAQAGFNLTKELSVWALYGEQKPNEDDAKAAGFTRLKNDTMNAQVIYRDGGYGLSAEWINFKTKMRAAATAPYEDEKANQFMASATYFF
jgi:hypothetical protein